MRGEVTGDHSQVIAFVGTDQLSVIIDSLLKIIEH